MTEKTTITIPALIGRLVRYLSPLDWLALLAGGHPSPTLLPADYRYGLLSFSRPGQRIDFR